MGIKATKHRDYESERRARDAYDRGDYRLLSDIIAELKEKVSNGRRDRNALSDPADYWKNERTPDQWSLPWNRAN